MLRLRVTARICVTLLSALAQDSNSMQIFFDWN